MYVMMPNMFMDDLPVYMCEKAADGWRLWGEGMVLWLHHDENLAGSSGWIATHAPRRSCSPDDIMKGTHHIFAIKGDEWLQQHEPALWLYNMETRWRVSVGPRATGEPTSYRRNPGARTLGPPI